MPLRKLSIFRRHIDKNLNKRVKIILYRRKLIGLLLIFGVSIGISFLGNFWIFRKIYYRFRKIFKTSNENKILNAKIESFEIPKVGYNISVETALNSRCTSDFDGDQGNFHWGLFDETKKLSEEQIKEILNLINIPRFTKERVEIRLAKNTFNFVIDGQKIGLIREHMMIESGMQQQALCLICSALGIGMVFENSTKDGRLISATDHENIKIKVVAMKPSYNGSYWSSIPPKGYKSWKSDNLPEPNRSGAKSLLSLLGNLNIKKEEGNRATLQSVSQLLWAAKGRTPHLYKSKPWGMTIPTWGGEQNITGLYLILDGELSKYINWRWNGWAHSLGKIGKIDGKIKEEIFSYFKPFNCLIIISKNENFSRALWEAGFQLLNLVLQASSLNLKFFAHLFDYAQRETIKRCGILEPICGLFVEYSS